MVPVASRLRMDQISAREKKYLWNLCWCDCVGMCVGEHIEHHHTSRQKMVSMLQPPNPGRRSPPPPALAGSMHQSPRNALQSPQRNALQSPRNAFAPPLPQLSAMLVESLAVSVLLPNTFVASARLTSKNLGLSFSACSDPDSERIATQHLCLCKANI